MLAVKPWSDAMLLRFRSAWASWILGWAASLPCQAWPLVDQTGVQWMSLHVFLWHHQDHRLWWTFTSNGTLYRDSPTFSARLFLPCPLSGSITRCWSSSNFFHQLHNCYRAPKTHHYVLRPAVCSIGQICYLADVVSSSVSWHNFSWMPANLQEVQPLYRRSCPGRQPLIRSFAPEHLKRQ